jgi:DNA-nicking Smr family endonuclease
MAKKPAKPKNQEFAHNPFRDLKGLSVSDAPKPGKKAASQPAPRPPAPKPAAPADDGELFAAEMKLLGVAKQAHDDLPEKPLPKAAESPAAKPQAPAKPAAPEDEFLAAIGRLDVTFSDEYPEPEPEADLPRPAPRRMRQLRRGQLVPEDQLDLHGLHREPALEKVRFFLQDAVYNGHRTVLIVTGRGQHSAEGPVLREAVARLLREDPDGLVLEWGIAPPRYGGDGALVVFLRGAGGA